MSLAQNTLAQAFTLAGVGVHTGAQGRVTVHPAEPGTGRVFRIGGATLPALAEFVTETLRCTTLSGEGVKVSTVEHLLSALAAFQIDNAVLEVEGPEIPILDGSALPWVEAIQASGVVAQGVPALFYSVQEPFTIQEGTACLHIEPRETEGLTLDVQASFDAWPEGTARMEARIAPETVEAYCTQIAPARTFAFRHEVEALLAAGLAKGGSLENALVITPPDGFSTPLRLPAEWCAHKVLDLIGDLALVGVRLNAHLRAERPGHRLNNLLARRLREAVGSRQ